MNGKQKDEKQQSIGGCFALMAKRRSTNYNKITECAHKSNAKLSRKYVILKLALLDNALKNFVAKLNTLLKQFQ